MAYYIKFCAYLLNNVRLFNTIKINTNTINRENVKQKECPTN